MWVALSLSTSLLFFLLWLLFIFCFFSTFFCVSQLFFYCPILFPYQFISYTSFFFSVTSNIPTKLIHLESTTVLLHMSHFILNMGHFAFLTLHVHHSRRHLTLPTSCYNLHALQFRNGTTTQQYNSILPPHFVKFLSYLLFIHSL